MENTDIDKALEVVMSMLAEHGICQATFPGPMPVKIRRVLFWNFYTFDKPVINYQGQYIYLIRKKKWYYCFCC